LPSAVLNQEFLAGSRRRRWPWWCSSAVFLLGVRSLLLLDIVVAAVLVWELATYTRPVPPGSLLVVAATAAIVLLFARSRGRLGVQGTRGDSMLVDLRDRLARARRAPRTPRRMVGRGRAALRRRRRVLR
jgi:hypothetical protein